MDGSARQGENPAELEFAGRCLSWDADGYLRMAAIDRSAPVVGPRLATILALALRDAFLLQCDWGWRFVEGVPEGRSPMARAMLDDAWPGAAGRAATLTALGVPVLSLAQAQDNVLRHAIPLHDATWM